MRQHASHGRGSGTDRAQCTSFERTDVVRFGRVEQSPELCALPALMRADRSRRAFGLPKLLVGAGRVMDVRGLAYWGVFVAIGTSLGG